MHPRPGNWMVIGGAVVYYVRAAHTFSAEIECQHCTNYIFFQQIHRYELGKTIIESKGLFAK